MLAESFLSPFWSRLEMRVEQQSAYNPMYEPQNFLSHCGVDLLGPGILDKDSLRGLRLDMRRNSWPPHRQLQ